MEIERLLPLEFYLMPEDLSTRKVCNSVINSDKARRESGYPRRSLQESIRDTMAWWFENRTHVKVSLRI